MSTIDISTVSSYCSTIGVLAFVINFITIASVLSLTIVLTLLAIAKAQLMSIKSL